MTRLVFGRIMAGIAAAIGKPLTAEAADVYFSLLGDLPFEVLEAAAKRVLLEHRWATFPSIAELRQAAAETIQGQFSELSPAEAWAIAWRAVGRIDLEVGGQADRELKRIPPIVAEAVRAYGLYSLVAGRENVSIVRAQFTKIFEQLAARERRTALLPAALKDTIARIGAESLPAIGQSAAKIARIGAMEPDAVGVA